MRRCDPLVLAQPTRHRNIADLDLLPLFDRLPKVPDHEWRALPDRRRQDRKAIRFENADKFIRRACILYKRQAAIVGVGDVALPHGVIARLRLCNPLQIFSQIDCRLRRRDAETLDEVLAVHLPAPREAPVEIDQAGEHRRLECGIIHARTLLDALPEVYIKIICTGIRGQVNAHLAHERLAPGPPIPWPVPR